MQIEKHIPCRFIFRGFSQDQGSRRFAYERVGADHVRAEFTVHADLALIPFYGIRVQELPLLCRELLERRADLEAACRLTYTEDDMRLQRDVRAIAAAQKKRSPRPVAGNAGRSSRTASLVPLMNQQRGLCMSIANQEISVVDEKLWNAWLQKTELRERRTAHRMKIAAGIAMALFGAGAALYFLS